MNKFALLLGLLLIFNFSKSEDEDQMSTIYDHVTYILEGMSKTGDAQCAAVFRNNKPEMLELLNLIMADIKAGTELSNIIIKYLGRLVLIDGLPTKCNLFNIIGVVDKFSSTTGIVTIGNNIANNADEIFRYVQEIKTKETLDEKLVPVGHILSLILDFYVS